MAEKSDTLFDDPSNFIEGWKSADDVALDVTAVSTIYPGFNSISQVGGLPVGRPITVHGPSHGSKTAFAIGLVKSFVDAGHIGLYIDAEHSTPRAFHEELLGYPLSERPNYGLVHPETYEEAKEEVNKLLKGMKAATAKGSERCAIVVVDTINKLVPKDEMDKALKDPEFLSKGHQGRDRASLNQTWMDNLTPRLTPARTAFVVIAQERQKPPPANPKMKVAEHNQVYIKGGDCLFFDASMVLRLSKRSPVYAGKKTGNDSIIGHRYKIRMYKNKVGHMEGGYSEAYFHLSNGKDGLSGFDIARDALEYAQDVGIIQVKGAWSYWGDDKYQGKDSLLQYLYENPTSLEYLLNEIAEAEAVIHSDEEEVVDEDRPE